MSRYMPFSHGHALLIGTGSYAHAPQLNVPITAADASAVAAVLRDPQFCGYPPEQVTLLSDAAARGRYRLCLLRWPWRVRRRRLLPDDPRHPAGRAQGRSGHRPARGRADRQATGDQGKTPAAHRQRLPFG